MFFNIAFGQIGGGAGGDDIIAHSWFLLWALSFNFIVPGSGKKCNTKKKRNARKKRGFPARDRILQNEKFDLRKTIERNILEQNRIYKEKNAIFDLKFFICILYFAGGWFMIVYRN